jgi:lipoprotein-anchoring transpeptidase ErfK/SrfK
MQRPVPRTVKPGRSLEADLGRQVLLAMKDGNVEWVFDVSSGKSSTPTPRGNFSIKRAINGQRVSALGQLWRPRYFTGGYAIHGSPSVPTRPASHGCVRLTNQEIDFIWAQDLAPIGAAFSVY